MHLRRALVLPAVLSLLWVGYARSAEGDVAAVYDAILRGDYEAGGAELTRLLETKPPAEPVLRVKGWLDSYRQVVSSRAELRERTFAWNVEHARAALSENKTYLALSFAAQAYLYAADKESYLAEPWVRDLRAKTLAAARKLEQEQHWPAAHSEYLLLTRLYPDDAEIEELRRRALRHVRVEVVYEDAAAVERRMRGVTKDLMAAALWQINDKYYQKPDFKRMAEGALRNLVALCETTKLYNIEVFDGIASPTSRAYFLGKIEEQRQKLAQTERFGYRDLKKLYNDLYTYNLRSISLPQPLLIIEFLEGALSELDDFTSIVWPADASEFEKIMMGGFQGVGIQLGLDEFTGRLKVVTPLEDSPALEAGIQPGDLIIEVDNRSTKGWTTDKAVREITGKAGTKVVLTMFRPSTGQRIPFTLERRRINLRTVQGVQRIAGDGGWNYLLDEDLGIAYIKLTNFNPASHTELDGALAEAKRQGMRALILDLRYNPGGLLDVAVDAVSTFLSAGDVVSTRGRSVPPQRLRVHRKPAYPDLPLVVLVNDASASASEILAGALHDHQRAMLLGERTFGKGSVQRLLPLGDQARLKLTTALYYLPSGRSPHKEKGKTNWGVDPDWEIVLTPKERGKILERERAAFVIKKPGADDAKQVDEDTRKQELEALKVDEEDNGDDEFHLLTDEDVTLLRSDPYEAPDADPQLATALLQLRVKLVGNLPWPGDLAAKTKKAGTP